MRSDFFLNHRVRDVTAIPCQQEINAVQRRNRDMNCILDSFGRNNFLPDKRCRKSLPTFQ